jgi:hypothetical protein
MAAIYPSMTKEKKSSIGNQNTLMDPRSNGITQEHISHESINLSVKHEPIDRPNGVCLAGKKNQSIS